MAGFAPAASRPLVSETSRLTTDITPRNNCHSHRQTVQTANEIALDMYAMQVGKQSQGFQKPEDNDNDNGDIKNLLNLPVHWNVSVY